MKREEPVLTPDLELSKLSSENLEQLHDLAHLYYDVLINSDTIQSIVWTEDSLRSKYEELTKLLNKDDYRDSLDDKDIRIVKEQNVNLTKIKNHEQLSNSFNNFTRYNLYQINSEIILKYSTNVLLEMGYLTEIIINSSKEQVIKLIEKGTTSFMITNDLNKDRQYYNSKTIYKPNTRLATKDYQLTGMQPEDLAYCVLHKSSGIQKVKAKLELIGYQNSLHRVQLKKIERDLKKINFKNYLLIGVLLKKGKKYCVEIIDVLYLNDSDLSKDSKEYRMNLFNKQVDLDSRVYIGVRQC